MTTVSKFERLSDACRSLFGRPLMALFVVVVVIVWRLALSSPADPDLFARTSMGRLVEILRGVPRYDPFAFTAKLPVWIDHEWLSGVVFYKIVSWWGDAGLILVKLVLSAWTALLLVRASICYSPQAAGRVLWVALCILEASYLWTSTLRCQVFTYFVIALAYYGYVLYRDQGIRRYLAVLPPAALALVNMHGGYALVVVTLWLLTACSLVRRERWGWLAAASALVTFALLATPYGPERFVPYLVHAIAMERPTIAEWDPLYRHPGTCIRMVMFAIPLVIGIIVQAKRRTWDLTAIAMLGFSFYCGISHLRFVGFAMLTAMVFGAQYVGQTVELARRGMQARFVTYERAGAVVGVVVLVVMILQIAKAAVEPDTWRLGMRTYPVAATEWLRESGATGKLLVDFNNGSFAQWRLYPRFTVSMDGRYEEVYTNETVERVPQAFMPYTPEGAASLQWVNPTHILFDASQDARKAQSALPQGWYEVYRDDQFAIVTKVANHPRAAPSATRVDLWSTLF